MALTHESVASEQMVRLAESFVRSGGIRWPKAVDQMPDHECEVFLQLVENMQNDPRKVK